MNDSSIRVVHLVNQYLPVTENWIAPVVRGADGIQSSVLSVRAPVNVEAFPVRDLEALETLDEQDLLAEARFLRRYGYVRRFRQAAERARANLLHAHFADLGIRAIGLSRRLRLPLVTSFYGYDLSQLPKQPVWADAYRALFAHGDAFVVEGSHARQCLLDLGCPPERVEVVRFGIDPATEFHPRTWRPGTPLRILMIARLVPKKGTVFALESLARFRQQRSDVAFEVTLVGDGPERDAVRSAIKRLALGDVVQMVPSWTHAEFVRRVGECHLLLQHSVTAPDGDHEGGAPVSLLEAQASGALIVSTRHADIPEYVRDGESGLLVPERDIAACAQAISELVDRAEQWPQMGRVGHDHVRSRYTVSGQLSHVLAIYARLAAQPRKRPSPVRLSDVERWPDLLWLGAFYKNHPDWDEASSVFRKIVAMDPDRTEARFMLAMSELRRSGNAGGRRLARLVSDQISRLTPEAAVSLARDAARWPAQRGLALEIADAVLARVPDYAPALYLRAGLELAAGRRGSALVHYRRILETSDDPLFVGGAHFHLAEDHLEAGRTEEARSAYRACLREIPNHRKAVERLLTLSGVLEPAPQ